MLDLPRYANKQDPQKAGTNKIFTEESPINKFELRVYSGHDLLQTLTTEDDEKPPVDNLTKSQVANYSCTICTKPALKYSSYGGRACSSCSQSLQEGEELCAGSKLKKELSILQIPNLFMIRHENHLGIF